MLGPSSTSALVGQTWQVLGPAEGAVFHNATKYRVRPSLSTFPPLERMRNGTMRRPGAMVSSRCQVNAMITVRMTPIPLVLLSPTNTGADHLAIRPRESKELELSTKKEANPLWRFSPSQRPSYIRGGYDRVSSILRLENFSPRPTSSSLTRAR